MKDRRGNPVSTRSGQALDHAEMALWRMMSFFDAPLGDIDAAIAQDPDWMLPHVMRAAFMLTLTEPSLMAQVHAALDRAQALATHASERERAHLTAARQCAAGDWHGACGAWGRILEAHPRDLYALQWAHLFDFYRGDAAQLEHRPHTALRHLDADDPLRPYVQGMQAFGLEESGCHDHAESLGRQACATLAKVPWATHAVAHVMEMQGRFADGLQWLSDTEPVWSEGNGFSGHHWWHRALFHLEGLDIGSALALYDAHLAGNEDLITLQRLDGAALLWRVHLLGGDVGTRWGGLAQGWDLSAAPVGHSCFNDLHALMVLLGQDRMHDAQQLIEAAQARVDSAGDDNAAMARDVGLPLMRGLLAQAQGRLDDAVQLIAPVRPIAHRFGGSHAQRDLITQTLLACGAGRAVLDERPQTQAQTPLTQHWSRLNA
ncbi:tetratricopeptide repeat protein [Piscinibacter terrae]|uniref:Tetratricopeptide repeat protein n=1 Tax=Piscinibacter terrae TaxID=2496871 RepID=A0A3N7HQV9_9BURK|nr:tetratricopeptide repeat protein [Albitalea terrae]RQP24073.1 tetratricopeptide repeat protein [Albitalea terrae]